MFEPLISFTSPVMDDIGPAEYALSSPNLFTSGAWLVDLLKVIGHPAIESLMPAAFISSSSWAVKWFVIECLEPMARIARKRNSRFDKVCGRDRS